MDTENKIQTRGRFIVFSLATAVLVTGFRYFIPRKKSKGTTVKMLTQDGKLVEVDVSKLPAKRKKIKDEDIHNWIVSSRSGNINPTKHG